MSKIVLDSSEKDALFRTIFEVLAIERSQPFWVEMGIDIEPSKPLQEIAQTYVERFCRNSNLRIGEKYIPPNELLSETFQAITQSIDLEIVEKIKRWSARARENYEEEDEAALLWLRSLRVVNQTVINGELITLDIPDSKKETLKDWGEEHYLEVLHLHSRIKAADQQPQSVWEQRVYPKYPLQLGSSLGWVFVQIAFRQKMSWWKKVERFLDNSEFEQLELWGEELVKIIKEPLPKLVREFDYEAIHV